MNRRFGPAVGLLLAVSLLGFSHGASASEPWTHDGPYLRLGVGPSYLSSTSSYDPNGLSLEGDTTTGLGATSFLLVGGTPSSGLTVGGGLLASLFPSPSVKRGPNEVDVDDPAQATLAGVFINYYLHPSGGLHGFAMLGASRFDPSEAADERAYGWGGAFGLGHDWWVGEEWSLGLMGTLLYLSTSKTVGDVGQRHESLVPVLSVDLTYH